VSSQIVSRTVSNTDALNPTVAQLNFSIPAIASIVSHFVPQVLSESKAVSSNTRSQQEQMRSAQEITQSLIRNHALHKSKTKNEETFKRKRISRKKERKEMLDEEWNTWRTA
jgi:hypothetical protein